jgi:hypothetical protein
MEIKSKLVKYERKVFCRFFGGFLISDLTKGTAIFIMMIPWFFDFELCTPDQDTYKDTLQKKIKKKLIHTKNNNFHF